LKDKKLTAPHKTACSFMTTDGSLRYVTSENRRFYDLDIWEREGKKKPKLAVILQNQIPA
jgi:hypothetical protein